MTLCGTLVFGFDAEPGGDSPKSWQAESEVDVEEGEQVLRCALMSLCLPIDYLVEKIILVQ